MRIPLATTKLHTSESVTYQGLHNTDKAFGLWNESWIGPDKTQVSVEQDAAIAQRVLDRLTHALTVTR